MLESESVVESESDEFQVILKLLFFFFLEIKVAIKYIGKWDFFKKKLFEQWYILEILMSKQMEWVRGLEVIQTILLSPLSVYKSNYFVLFFIFILEEFFINNSVYVLALHS